MRAGRFVVLFGAAILCLALFSPSISAASNMDGVMMQNGKMMMMKDGKATGPMESDLTMLNGAKMMMDGTMMMKDGNTKTLMKDGQMMMMDGKLMEGGKAMGMENH